MGRACLLPIPQTFDRRYCLSVTLDRENLHESTAFPSMITVQHPHAPLSQEILVPVKSEAFPERIGKRMCGGNLAAFSPTLNWLGLPVDRKAHSPRCRCLPSRTLSLFGAISPLLLLLRATFSMQSEAAYRALSSQPQRPIASTTSFLLCNQGAALQCRLGRR